MTHHLPSDVRSTKSTKSWAQNSFNTRQNVAFQCPYKHTKTRNQERQDAAKKNSNFMERAHLQVTRTNSVSLVSHMQLPNGNLSEGSCARAADRCQTGNTPKDQSFAWFWLSLSVWRAPHVSTGGNDVKAGHKPLSVCWCQIINNKNTAHNACDVWERLSSVKLGNRGTQNRWSGVEGNYTTRTCQVPRGCKGMYEIHI